MFFITLARNSFPFKASVVYKLIWMSTLAKGLKITGALDIIVTLRKVFEIKTAAI